MLILPMERTFDIRRPPVVTFLLLVINVIVFMVTNGIDAELTDEAVAEYEAEDILDIELPFFQDYLTGVPEVPDHWRTMKTADDIGEEERYYLVLWMLSDGDYLEFLENSTYTYTAKEEQALEKKSEIVETLRSSLIAFRFGFVPEEFSVLTMFTSQFLHGDTVHLISNMVILVLIGLTVEQLLGSFNYLIFYLLSGAVGSILYGLVHWGGTVPLVGASGAISGVMGMYVAAYGKKPIRFFYWIGFYFNYIKLPALVMLPVWVGKEVFDFIFSDTNVAYSAHAGGLVAGAALVAVGKSSFAKIDTEVMDNRDLDSEYRDDLAHALNLVDNANFEAARDALLRLLKRYPDDDRVLYQLVQIARAKPGSKDYHVVTFKYLKSALSTGKISTDTLRVIRDYWKNALPGPRIQGPPLSQLINKLVSQGEFKLADEICKSAEEHNLLDPDALKQANEYRTSQQRAGARA